MSWFRRKRKDIFDDIFEDIFEEFERIQDMFRSLIRESFEKEFEKLGAEGKPIVYGVRITIGPDGVPRVEEFGNVKLSKVGKPIVREEMEPLVDVMDVGDEIWVIAELPGVSKEKIKVKATENKVTIKAENDRKYYKEIELPAEVDPDTAKASYRNGVLEIKLKKKASSKEEEGKEIKIE
ncbi:MAG: Hsp20/alpha crystallin family protein [Desulfurococcales archaeon]|nr:Hsp20/alpha crystallin family protein [Desulfurococcales archaeon]